MKDYYRNTTININGKIVKDEDAQISVFDRGFLFGDSIYEVSYTKDRALLFWPEHLQRLLNSARLLNIELDYTEEEITKQVLETLRISNISDAYFRVIITRGCSEINLNPNIATHNNLIIIVKPKPVYSHKMYSDGIELLLSSVHRNSSKSTDPNAKSGNYLNSVMAIDEAKAKGIYDSVMVNSEGQLTEGTSFNLWLIKDNKIITPKKGSGLLLGITRAKILSFKKLNEYQILDEILLPEDLNSSQEMFITSSTRGVMPVKRIYLNESSYIDFPSQDVTNQLKEIYDQYVINSIKSTSLQY